MDYTLGMNERFPEQTDKKQTVFETGKRVSRWQLNSDMAVGRN